MTRRLLCLVLVAVLVLVTLYVLLGCQLSLADKGFYVGVWCHRPIANSELLFAASVSDVADWTGIGFSVGLR